jgi:hypothetical protein
MRVYASRGWPHGRRSAVRRVRRRRARGLAWSGAAVLLAFGLIAGVAAAYFVPPTWLPTVETSAAGPGPEPLLAALPAGAPIDDVYAAPAGPPIPLPVANEPLLPNRRIVSYYGNPLAPAMGVLGEQPLNETVQRLRKQAQAYADADPSRPVQPALQLITPVAQAGPGRDGLYRLRMDSELIDEVARVAEQEHFLLILDVQIGQSTVPDELEPLRRYLERPYVHLALDPEFAMADKHGEPGEVIGTLDAADVNYAIGVLSDIVTTNHLPPKVLIVHRFLEKMLTHYQAVQPTSSVQVIMDMDGFGAPFVKADKYRSFVHDQSVQYGGLKLFYKHDKPLWTPTDVIDLEPTPDIVIYQ